MAIFASKFLSSTKKVVRGPFERCPLRRRASSPQVPALAPPEILLLWDKTHRLLLLRRTCCRFNRVDSSRAALRPVIPSQSISEGLRHMPCPSHVIIPSTSFSFARTDWVGTTAKFATAFQPLRNLMILRAADQAAFDSQSSPVSFSKPKKKGLK